MPNAKRNGSSIDHHALTPGGSLDSAWLTSLATNHGRGAKSDLQNAAQALGASVSAVEVAKFLDKKFQDLPSFQRAAFLVPSKGGLPGIDPALVRVDEECVYLVGNSLGLQPSRTRVLVSEELDKWAKWGVNGHFTGDRPWMPIDETVIQQSAAIVGAEKDEVAIMNSLTVNLHLLFVSFYRPEGSRNRIMYEASAFGSDYFAFESQARLHGLDPTKVLLPLNARTGEELLHTEDIVSAIQAAGDSLAVVCLGTVQYYTGQYFDVKAITEAAHAVGAMAIWDCAHAVGNVDLSLHEWGVDGACWCNYKYLNAGPGAIGGFFVHRKHLNKGLPLLAGWWGQKQAVRFNMEHSWDPEVDAGAWRLSNPPVLQTVSLLASLEIFSRTTMSELRGRFKKGIKVEKMSKEEADKKFGVSSWPTWGCGASKFDWEYSGTETAYILEGEVTVTPTGEWSDADPAKIEELSGEDLVKHEKFLKAKEEALSQLSTKRSAPAKDGGVSLRTTQQSRLGGAAFDEETARKLEAIAGRAAQDATRRELEKAKEASRAVADAQAEAQSSLQAAVAHLSSEPKAASLMPTWISDDEYRDLGYPQMDPKFRDREWHRKQLQLDSTDPRHNPNLNRDQSDPEFWYHAARRPFNKALLRTEQHWNARREVWLKQFEQVKDMNQRRELLSDLLEDSPADVKRLVTPILHYSITMNVLIGFLEKAERTRRTFEEVLLDEENLNVLRGIRDRIDAKGDQAADEMLQEYDARSRLLAFDAQEKKEGEEQERRVADVTTLAQIMNWGQKCKKDGLVEWEQGNYAEARASWRQAHETLRPFKAADNETNELLFELHAAVLKNLAQASMKLGYWNEATKVSTLATQLCPEDHKAWFRRACALEGMGSLDEAERCLQKIDECSVGRPDRLRIAKDTQAKREKLQALREREQASLKRTMEKALGRSVFSEERQVDDEKEAALDSLEPDEQRRALPTPNGIFQDSNRKHLTREGAKDLLHALRDAYRDSTFQKQVMKLARDVRGEKRPFLANLAKVALPLQKPVLEKFGFEPSEKGLKEMMRAVQDYTRGPKADAGVKRAADETTVALYGVMYDTLTRPDDAAIRPQLEARLGRGHDAEDA
ncbi:kynu [Symbiodinium necroappetens]|uniref:Kynureninase n=1 Tax=Symbiodinium necroappetens TaxID=1628268 RepID=A0A813A6C8_9DINO|nr:kynu [Symbiodinium necroappetens]